MVWVVPVGIVAFGVGDCVGRGVGLGEGRGDGRGDGVGDGVGDCRGDNLGDGVGEGDTEAVSEDVSAVGLGDELGLAVGDERAFGVELPWQPARASPTAATPSVRERTSGASRQTGRRTSGRWS
jgi:hypothetical protein